MKFNRRQGLKAAAATAAATGAIAAAAPREAMSQTRAETLRQVMGGVINSLDATMLGGTREGFGLVMNTYDRLCSMGRKPVSTGGFTFDLDNIRGELAERIDRSADGLTYTFHIRQGAMWHDGTPVTAEDVKWSLDRSVSARSLAPAQMSMSSYTSTDQYKVVGERSVEVKLPRSDRLALGNLSTPYAMMINSKLAKQHATSDDPWAINWLKENQAGGGAYIVESHRPGQQMQLRRNENWKNGLNGELPFFRRIIMQTVPEAATRASLVERGDADLCIDLAASDVPAIESRNRAKVVAIPQGNTFQCVVFNTRVAPFVNPKVRRAFALALPYDAMFQAALFSRGSKYYGATWTQAPNGNFPQPLGINQDLDRAKALLAEAGFPNGLETTFTYAVSMSAFVDPMAALLQEALGRIGVRVALQKLPDAQIGTLIVERRLPFFTDLGSAWLPSPDYFFRLYYSGETRWNYSGWQNAEVAAMAQEARFTLDQARYDDICRRMIDISMEQMPHVMLWSGNHEAVMSKDISGYTYWFHRMVDWRDLKRG